jgi:MoxR-like ATPase
MYSTQVRDSKNFERVEIEGKIIRVPYPEEIPEIRFAGREAIIERALAAWLEIDGFKPLNFRLFGPPGTGKNAIVYELSRLLKKDLYIINGHDELGPEDIACSATMTSGNTIEYVASPLFAAMLRGGIIFFDEIGKAPERALSPLASVLDERRSLTSVLAGIHLKAREGFLFCAALNENEEEGIGLPGFLDERTRPSIYVGHPGAAEIEEILRCHVPSDALHWIKIFVDIFKAVELSTRNAITILEFAYKMSRRSNGNSKPGKGKISDYLTSAYESNYGEIRKDAFTENEKQGAKNDFHKFVTGPESTIH